MNSKFVDEYNRENVQKKLVNSARIEEKMEIAKKMLAKGIDIKDIAEITSLSIEEINDLRQD